MRSAPLWEHLALWRNPPPLIAGELRALAAFPALRTVFILLFGHQLASEIEYGAAVLARANLGISGEKVTRAGLGEPHGLACLRSTGFAGIKTIDQVGQVALQCATDLQFTNRQRASGIAWRRCDDADHLFQRPNTVSGGINNVDFGYVAESEPRWRAAMDQQKAEYLWALRFSERKEIR